MNIYEHQPEIHNTASAEQIVPFIMSIVKPKSVIDLGCGLGSWLKVFNEHGLNDILGVNQQSVEIDLLNIPSKYIQHADLNKDLNISRRFDLALSLETAEHLNPESAAVHVQQLVQLSDWILFSAAIPGQGGQNHLNEQWVEYWQNLFKKYDYYFWDIIRPRFWNNANVFWWYRQNIFLVANKKSLLEKDPDVLSSPIHSLIHPELHKLKVKKIEAMTSKANWIRRCLNYLKSLI